ncbi:MAG: imidazole glycerol phosphate synthase subunit HisH [Chitinophagaceae bacterium]|nr:imidazole glycerol phosphate synthase subunit HisH [Chitinophagaceae bacterium]MBK8951822.1 imidazole glycerol phosphate synthase subunit HisH [Chitinophagaceae bacterium]
MSIVIIKYNAGNIQSVLFALERLGINAIVTEDAAKIVSADKIIFPGVGEASTAMQYLKERKLNELIISLKQPVLGICLGMQLLCNYSEEGNTKCLGIFESVSVKRFTPVKSSDKVPQVGWNTVTNLKSPLFNYVSENSYCYFVHGYYAEESEYTIATTNYTKPYSAALQKNNFFGVQFHPEKSAKTGDVILKNFLSL